MLLLSSTGVQNKGTYKMKIIEVEKMKRKEELLIPSVILGLFMEVRKGAP